MKQAIILVAHGSRDPQWARPFEQLAARLSTKVETPVSLAFLESMAPSLGEAIARRVAEGVTALRVVPLFFGQGGHVKAGLPRLLADAREKHPHVCLNLDAPIGEQEPVIEAIASAIARQRFP